MSVQCTKQDLQMSRILIDLGNLQSLNEYCLNSEGTYLVYWNGEYLTDSIVELVNRAEV